MSATKSKFNAKKVYDDGYVFDSMTEHRRYLYLKMFQMTGVVQNLRVHVPIELLPVMRKPTIRAVVYEADFIYDELSDGAWRTVVEDVKGMRTPVFNLKLNLLERMARSRELDIKIGAKHPVVINILDAKGV